MRIIDFIREIEEGVWNLLSSDRFRLEPAVRLNLAAAAISANGDHREQEDRPQDREGLEVVLGAHRRSAVALFQAAGGGAGVTEPVR
jgi:hypothetical protein